MSDTRKFAEMFDYLQAPVTPNEATGALVFGRHDVRLADTMGKLAKQDLAPWFVITGGLGKDSGELWDTHTPEAQFISETTLSGGFGIAPESIYLEPRALNGKENARFGLQTMRVNRLDHESVIAVAHATSLRRLAATLEHEGKGSIQTVYRVPTDYPFDPENQKDQLEAAAELLRLADWPMNGGLPVQTELPDNLVDFARSVTDTPRYIGAISMAIVRNLPIKLRRSLILKQADVR